MKSIFSRLVKYFSRKKPVVTGSVTKSLLDLPIHFREAIALHNVFMAFGIPERDIYVAYTKKSFQVIAYQDRDDILFDVDKKKQENRREFCVAVADLDMEDKVFEAAWR